MTEKYQKSLQQYSKLVRDQIHMIESGAKLNIHKREEKPRQKQLKDQLKGLLQLIAKNGQINSSLWADFRSYLLLKVRQTLDAYQEKYKDSKTFEQQKQIILLYIAQFAKPPFTIQRIAQLTLSPQKFYQSSRKILYAYEKLVNVCDPTQ